MAHNILNTNNNEYKNVLITTTTAPIINEVIMTEAETITKPISSDYNRRSKYHDNNNSLIGSHSSRKMKTLKRSFKHRLNPINNTKSIHYTNTNTQGLSFSNTAFSIAPPCLSLKRHRHYQQQQKQFYEIPYTNQIMNSSTQHKYFNSDKKIDFLLDLPFELSIQILSYLDNNSLIQISLVSKRGNEFFKTKDIWRPRVIEQQWQPSCEMMMALLNHQIEIDWLHIYKQKYQINKRWSTGQVNTQYLTGHKDSVYCLQFDQEKVITGSRDRSIKIWNLFNYQCVRTLYGHRGSVLCLKYNDHIMVSGSSDTTLIIWDMHTLQPIKLLKGHTGGVLDVAMNDQYIVSCSKDTTIRIWDIKTGKLLRTIEAHHGPVNAIQLKDNKIVSASGDALVKMWDIETGSCIREYTGHTRGLACVQYDGKRIFSGSNDKTIRIWDAKSGKCTMILEGHTDLVRTLHFNDNRIVSASYDQSVRVWDINSGCCLLNFQSGHTSWVLDVSFDKTKIISASQDHSILVMDFAKGLDTRFI